MSNNNKLKVLGLSGGAASGKDTVASLFEKRGFIHISTSNIVRGELSKIGQKPTRELQTKIANEFRTNFGGAFFVLSALGKFLSSEQPPPILLSGIYAPAEGLFIKNILNGDLVMLDTAIDDESLSTRYDRLKSRSDGSRDSLSFMEFLQAEQRENAGTTEEQANIAALRHIARFSIFNTVNTTIDQLDKQVDMIVKEIG